MQYVEDHSIFELMNTIVYGCFVKKEANPRQFMLEYLQKEVGGAQQSQAAISAATSDVQQEQAEPKKKRAKAEDVKPAEALNDTIDRSLHFLEPKEVEGAQQSQASSSAATSDAKPKQAGPKRKRAKAEDVKSAEAVNVTIDRTLLEPKKIKK